MSKAKIASKDVSRIHSSEAKRSGGEVKSKSFTARATRAVAKKGSK